MKFPLDWPRGAVAAAGLKGGEDSSTGEGSGPPPTADGAGGGGTGVPGAGVYFAFNSARIDPASDRNIAALAGILARHPD